jgi:peptide/nickel transport system substrate-binding protein
MVPAQKSLPSRRHVLGTVATGAVAGLSGCLQRLRSMMGWQSRSRISLTIVTTPADDDPFALHVARRLASWYDAAGLDASVQPLAEEALYRRVLLGHDYDVFVGRLPHTVGQPDALYSLLHSRYADDPGWQNPFGYANLGVDERLVAQRQTTGEARRSVVGELLRSVARTQPFSTVVLPDDIRAARTTRFSNWTQNALETPTGYLALERSTGTSRDTDAVSGSVDGGTSTDADDDAADDTLRVVVTDDRVTGNLNPLAVEYRRDGFVMGLLYDSLGYETASGRVEPWLATTWDVSTTAAPTATVALREDLTWHDGEALTASDVAFTFALLDDTTFEDPASNAGTTTEGAADASDAATSDAGSGRKATTSERTTATDERSLPAPRFRGRASLVEDVAVVDDTTVEFEFAECTPTIARRAFTVPLLPEHVWRERTGTASISGIEFGPATEALVTNNVPPVGSGPFQYASNAPRESLTLERFDDHFLHADAPTTTSGQTPAVPAFERVKVRAVGSDATAVDLVADDEADVTGTPVGTGTVPRIGREPDLDLHVSTAVAPYVVGYNAQRPPLTNPRFRNTLARLIDQSAIADDTFDGYATPAVTPLSHTRWLPDALAYEQTNPVTPFLGTDGELDVPLAREAFRQAGFEYVDGSLVSND